MAKDTKSKLSAEDFVTALRKIIPESPDKNQDFPKILSELKINCPLLLNVHDPLRAKRLIDWIKNSYFNKSQTSNVSTYFGDELKSAKSIDLIINSLNSLSLFSSSQLLVIYDFDKIKADLAKKLAEALLQPNLSAVPILCAHSLGKNSALTTITKKGTVIEVAELKGNLLNRWIQKEAMKAGAKGGIEPRAVELLAKSHAGDTFSLSQELAKLALLTDEKGQITFQLTNALLFKSPERTSFDLVTAIASGNLILATNLTASLLDQGVHPLQLNGFLSKAFRTMLANKGVRSETPSFSNPWFVRNLSTAMNKFSEKNLVSALDVIKDLDFKIKSSKLSEETLMILAIQKLTNIGNLPLSKVA
jgi:DNA polymerase III delta subunit